ncbi:hybrid sensor histidine kinase/response regulator [uncultured Aquabacterium sp.]|uniref:ATP-binding response regulator n=1 Tax=Aquabacterium commune TaxID=70586 RepID=UPI0030CD3593
MTPRPSPPATDDPTVTQPPPGNGRVHQLMQLGRRLGSNWLVAPLLLLSFWVMVTLQPEPQNAPGVQWSSIRLVALQDDLSGENRLAQAINVQLPHSWQPNGLMNKGVGRYELLLAISAPAAQDAAQQPWAMRINRLSPAHRIWLNGQLVHSTLPRSGWLTIGAPHLLDLPGGSLRPGQNTLVIETHCAAQCGLTPVTLSRKADLHLSYALYRMVTRDLLVVLNIVCITFSLFVVTLWWMRRQEATAGLFGLLMTVGALRNCRYFVEGDLQLSANVDSWLYFTAHVVATCLQSWFILALSRTHWPALHRVLCVVLPGFPLIALAAMPWDPGLTHTRNILQGALLLLLPPSLLMLKRSHTLVPGHLLFGMGVGWLCALLASIHDFALGRIVGNVTFSYWMPWAIPMMMPQFAVLVIQRIATAFDEIEQANQHLETKVAERTRELAAANAAKSHFLASASHDLRQPVAAIGLITDLLQSRVTDPALRSLTDRLTRAVNSMESLLKGLLDLSRLDSGTVDVQRRRVKLQPLLEAVTNHEMESARHKGLWLRIRPTDATVWTDPVLLEQILRNLVGNAIRHTTQGGVLVGMRRRGNTWVLQVWDSGPGIEPADQQRIFEAFVQLSNPARERSQGLGLGLAIVQRAATLLDHAVGVRSVVGRGSVFSVTMPAATLAPGVGHGTDTAASGSTLQAGPTGASTALPAIPARRVLVIEDDRGLRDTLVSLLQSWGVAEVHAGDSLASVKTLPAGHWDLVVSDHRLGDGTGREVIAHLRAAQPRLPALILTGDTSPEQLAELARSGLPVLHKPFRSEKMRAMIVETMARAADRDDSV